MALGGPIPKDGPFPRRVPRIPGLGGCSTARPLLAAGIRMAWPFRSSGATRLISPGVVTRQTVFRGLDRGGKPRANVPHGRFALTAGKSPGFVPNLPPTSKSRMGLMDEKTLLSDSPFNVAPDGFGSGWNLKSLKKSPIYFFGADCLVTTLVN